MFRKRRPETRQPPAGERSVFTGLRDQLLTLDPTSIGLKPTTDHPRVWGALMDMGRPNDTWATIVALADGTTSLYTSTGGGIIGAGTRPAVAAASAAWLWTVEQHLDLLPVATGSRLPLSGLVTIRALCFGQHHAIEAPEDDLGHGRHPAAVLFHSAQGVITQLRITDEAKPN
jgi:hypothetical protein